MEKPQVGHKRQIRPTANPAPKFHNAGVYPHSYGDRLSQSLLKRYLALKVGVQALVPLQHSKGGLRPFKPG
jgi:hypothetical protein